VSVFDNIFERMYVLIFSYFCNKCYQVIPDVKLKISLQELSLKGKLIIAQQSEIRYADALRQVQLLKRISKVKPSLKRNRHSL
jgi:hypothetical protein